MAERVHWLLDTARRAGLAVADAAPVDAAAPLADAWAAVARAAGTTEDQLARQVATHYRLGAADLQLAEPRALSLVPEKVARRHHVFPLRETDRQLVVATANPNDLDAEQALAFASGRTTVFEVAPPTAIMTAIDAHYAPDRVVETLLDRVGAEVAEDIRLIEEVAPEAVATGAIESTPVVKLTSLIIGDAVKEGASDIHLEPGRDGGTVRFRVDGVLRTHMQLPMPALNRVVSRIKVMSKMDIADRLRPQDGRARVQAHGRTLDLRISTVPTRDAEKAVIRLLDTKGNKTLDDLAMPAHELSRFRRLLSHRDGIVVVTGPTGSGKTTTLYAAIGELATGEVNIMTVEDPVEYELKGLTQIQVEPKRGVTFASALRSILRQDPDVIFVGEIRDLETAEVAVQAALTGHLVLATLHTNDAVGAVARFADLGLDRAKIAGALRGAVAQRLLRRVCSTCAVPVAGALTADESRLAARYGTQPMMRTVGCAKCGRTGYRGRLPVLEVLLATAAFEPLITAAASGAELQKAAVTGGLRPLRDVALEHVRSGATTLQEVDRVLGDSGSGGGGGGAEPPTPSVEAQPHILLVDDDAVNRTVARAVLEKNGFRVSEVGDGVAALERLDGPPEFNLMILDLDMPRLGGMEVLARVRKTVATAGMPVIVLTGSTTEDSEIAVMESGADDYVRKPLDPARFLARVKAALRRAGSGG
jgi:type II secretory ATPase GspE/PulE/Tfp pilus assembly ATPase PilB-like protein/ActR/RegA family two-component response regulator